MNPVIRTDEGQRQYCPMKPPTIAYCIEVSACGIAFTRSFTRPYVAEKINRAWWLHDERPLGRQRRNDEWFAPVGTDPELLHSWACARTAKKFIICAVVKDAREQVELLTKYRNLGYRLWRTEALMARTTTIDPSVEINSGLIFVDTQSMVSRLTKAAGERMILPEHLEKRPMPVRCHAAVINDQLVGWVRSVSIGDASWCASLFVEPAFRRRGIGRSLMATMLRADRTSGLSASILIASHTGAILYRSIGYQTIGTILVLNPPNVCHTTDSRANNRI
jgi:GNAT superfamily N-acetyltransferase